MRIRKRQRRESVPSAHRAPPCRGVGADPSPLPPPEEVFCDWLMSVPHGEDIEAAAREQVGIIDSRRSSHPDVQHLRLLLVAIAGGDRDRQPPVRL